MFAKVIDKIKLMFYTSKCQVKNKDPTNHTNGVGAPLIWTGLLHTNKFNAKWD